MHRRRLPFSSLVLLFVAFLFAATATVAAQKLNFELIPLRTHLSKLTTYITAPDLFVGENGDGSGGMYAHFTTYYVIDSATVNLIFQDSILVHGMIGLTSYKGSREAGDMLDLYAELRRYLIRRHGSADDYMDFIENPDIHAEPRVDSRADSVSLLTRGKVGFSSHWSSRKCDLMISLQKDAYGDPFLILISANVPEDEE